MTVDYRTGPALDLIREIPDGSVDLVSTSPPFLALRNYNDQPGQWGAEGSPAGFLANLLTFTGECRRVLAPHGTVAFELGDTYSGSGGAGGDYNAGGMRTGQARFSGSASRAGKVGPGWPDPKSMCLIPQLFPACLAYGFNLLAPDQQIDRWLVRNVIAWARDNPPVGALGDKFRPATSHITVATPSPRRWFDLDAVRGHPRPENERGTLAVDGKSDRHTIRTATGTPPLDHWWDEVDGDLVWLVNTQGSNLSHYAMWPPKLAERLVLSMCPPRVCRTCGEPSRRIVHRQRRRPADDSTRAKNHASQNPHSGFSVPAPEIGWEYDRETLGWSDCGHDDWRPGMVLDPFAGAGTTIAVADIHGRDAIGFDLDPANPALYPTRHAQCWKAIGKPGPPPVTDEGVQAALFDLEPVGAGS